MDMKVSKQPIYVGKKDITVPLMRIFMYILDDIGSIAEKSEEIG